MKNSDRDVKSSMSPLHSSRLILYFHTKNRISRRCINLGSSMRALTPMNLAILFLGSILSKEMIKPSFILPLDSFAGKDGVHYSVPQLTEYLGAVMHPTLIEFSDRVGIHSYGLLILTALLFAFMVSSRRAKTVGIDPDDLPLMYLLVAMCGILGARLFYFLFSDTTNFLANPLIFFDGNEGGLVFYGGAIGGVLSGVIYCYLRKIPVWKMADIGAPAIMLGLAIGRLGCFFAGCCHGMIVETDGHDHSVLMSFKGGDVLWLEHAPYLALSFNPGVGVGAIFHTPTYPTQLWEFTGAMTLFLVLSLIWKRQRYFDGQILALMMVMYAGLRTTIENFRGDSIRGEDIMSGLSTSQSISVFSLVLAIVIAIIQFRKGVAHEELFVSDLEDDFDDYDDLEEG